jgi:drug/metabolite transporter (DMT)-like permease
VLERKEVRGWLALIAVYIFWGSTYLAIRIGVQSFPPFALGGVRYLIAGAILCGATWRQAGGLREPWLHWRSAFVIGFLMLIGGNGAVILAEQTVPSGIASLVVATVPFWLVLLEAISRRQMIRPVIGAGLIVGFLGIALLASPSQSHQVDLRGVATMLVGSFLWAAGSLYSRGARQAQPALRSVGMQMLAGGAMFALLSAASGELSRVQWSPAAGLALLWLIIFGSLVGFTSYILALRLLPTTTVSTYAFVNPIIAVLLGWLLLSEAISLQTIAAMGTTVAGVVCILVGRQRKAPE